MAKMGMMLFWEYFRKQSKEFIKNLKGKLIAICLPWARSKDSRSYLRGTLHHPWTLGSEPEGINHGSGSHGPTVLRSNR
ncbi:MAG: hypothetical protein WCG05_01300 [Alphaproteobacteria bacterium]